MNLNYNDDGCLVYGIHDVSLSEFEDEFVKGKSKRRQEIYECYKNHLKEIESTDCCLNHWIDGSFVTLKENPGDIDTFTEFDGVKVKKLGILDDIENIIYNAPLRLNNFCHSFHVYKVPKSFGKDYDEYLDVKSRTLYLLFSINEKTQNPKGFIKLKKVT